MPGWRGARGWPTDDRLDLSAAVATSDRGNRDLHRLLRLPSDGVDRLLRATGEDQEPSGDGHQRQTATNTDAHVDLFEPLLVNCGRSLLNVLRVGGGLQTLVKRSTIWTGCGTWLAAGNLRPRVL